MHICGVFIANMLDILQLTLSHWVVLTVSDITYQFSINKTEKIHPYNYQIIWKLPTADINIIGNVVVYPSNPSTQRDDNFDFQMPDDRSKCLVCVENGAQTQRPVDQYAATYSISQEICTRFLLCCALLWLYIDWFSHIYQAYFTGTVAI